MRNGLSESEAGKLGAIATKKMYEARKLKAIQIYNEAPCKCQYCGNNLPYEKRFNKTCSRKCAAYISNMNREPMKQETKDKISKSLKKFNDLNVLDKEKQNFIKKNKIEHKYIHYKKIRYCTWCGAEKGKCEHPEICKKHQLFKTLSIFGFDLNTIGTNKIFNEYIKTKSIIEDFYIKNGAVDNILEKTFNYKSGGANFHKILKSLGIKSRNFSESQKFSILNKHRSVCTNTTEHTMFIGCQQGWYKTWNNKEVYLRSSYEYDYAKYLDELKVDYLVEDLRIEYFDSQKNSYHIAVPDFYLPETNTIIEIKSTFTLDIQNMKDKVKSYKEHGYNFKLILEHKETDLDDI